MLETETSSSFVETALDRISQTPRLWNILRWIVEAGFRGERAVIQRELHPWRDIGRRMFLDFGCGTGEFADSFPSDYYLGVDLSPIYVRFAGQNSARRSFAVADGAMLSLANASFDAALVLGVLHHLPDEVARAAMNELHRVLRPGAMALVIEDVPPPDIWNIAGHVMHWLDRGGFIRNEADYRAIFGDGFTIIRSYPMRSGICDYSVYVLKRETL